MRTGLFVRSLPSYTKDISLGESLTEVHWEAIYLSGAIVDSSLTQCLQKLCIW